MRRLALLLLPLAGCLPRSGELAAVPVDAPADADDDDDAQECLPAGLDGSLLGPADHGDDYQGFVRVRDYAGPARFDLVGGALPEGLNLFIDGLVRGVPSASGAFELRIAATELSEHPDVEGCLILSVSPPDTEPALGYVHDQATTLTTETGVQVDLWVRIAQGGEQAQQAVTLRPGVYLSGPNGDHEQGGGDDVLQESLDLSEVTVTLGEWRPVQETGSGDHTNEGSPPSYEAGIFTAGTDTGHLPFTITHPDYGAVPSKLQVVPPDWCPGGVSSGPGDGACQ